MVAKAKVKIMDAAQALIIQCGYHGTGTNAIIDKAKVSKGSFFYHFPDKLSLIREILERYVQESLFEPFEQAVKSHSNPQDALIAFIDHIEKWYTAEGFKGGCLLGNMALELSDTQDEIRNLLTEKFAGWEKRIIDLLKGVSLSLPTHRFVALYIASIEGVGMTNKVYKNQAKSKEEWQACRDLVNLAFLNNR
jgi:TetR/AcrR family transcriptional repressor of nem operon